MYKEISRTGRFTETENREVVTQGMAEMWGVEAEGQSYLLEAVNRLYIWEWIYEHTKSHWTAYFTRWLLYMYLKELSNILF